MKYILAIDQGTTSSRAILFDKNLKVVSIAQKEFEQHFPHSGWVEHDPEDIYESVVETCKEVLKKQNIDANDIVSIGITNQRETSVVWEKKTGKAIYNAIVWQDRRTASLCQQLKPHEPMLNDKTGLLFDPYFSGTKLKWILENMDGAKQRAENGELLFGTIDSFLIYRLTGGKVHATDATNAARTMLYNIKNNAWDREICSLLDIPMGMLPEVKDCADDFGSTRLFGGSIPINGVAGDQQAASIGQACFSEGMIKSTYGTGCFVLLNTGSHVIKSKNKLLGTIAYRLDGKTTYALEGSIFIAGAVVQWLRDGLKIIKNAQQTQELAQKAHKNERVYLVPAFTGLGSPYWDSECRGAMYGLTRNTNSNDIARAALESVAYQTKDLLDAMMNDCKEFDINPSILRVDGGMSASDWTMQFLSSMLNLPIDRPKILETTALGVAYMAGMKSGFYPDLNSFTKNWHLGASFSPNMDELTRNKLYNGWKDAIGRTLVK
ncbi:MAG: glycerol kinase [Proteobacteria bacterium]|nr:MAG: glycerol kinase [Pseudomonadota bacterium]